MTTAMMHRNWGGAQHARMTRSMQALPLAARAILQHLRTIIPDGETAIVSQVEIADGANVSESTVSRCMPRLIADGWIVRSERNTTGRGHGYAIMVLPPPELLAAESRRRSKGTHRPGQFLAPSKGSIAPGDDDSPDPASYSSSRTIVLDSEGSIAPTPILIDHDHQNQQQQAPPDSDLLQELAGDDPQVVREVIAANPNLTVAEFRGQLATATERPDVRNPRGLALHCLANGQRVTPARRITERKRERQGKPAWDAPASESAWFVTQAAERTVDDDQEYTPPDDATEEERAIWHEQVADGATTAEAYESLQFRRVVRKPVRGAR